MGLRALGSVVRTAREIFAMRSRCPVRVEAVKTSVAVAVGFITGELRPTENAMQQIGLMHFEQPRPGTVIVMIAPGPARTSIRSAATECLRCRRRLAAKK